MCIPMIECNAPEQLFINMMTPTICNNNTDTGNFSHAHILKFLLLYFSLFFFISAMRL